ncbi:DISARM system helicase DrmA [Thermomonospora echinospora]|nr:DISARM system helicase DrmA [Thermomonospora echinospora]
MTDQPPVLQVPDAAVIRDELTELVCNDLHGPAAGEHEEFGERPTDRYLLGRLAPNGAVVDPGQGDRLSDVEPDAESGDGDQDTPNVPSMFPSAYGFTAYVDGETDRLVVKASWARYVRAHSSEEEHAGQMVWRREPLSGVVTVPLRPGEVQAQSVTDEQPEIVVRGRIREYEGHWLVTLFLVNSQRGEDGDNAKWIFQARMSASAPDRSPAFLRRPVQPAGGDQADQAEQRRLAMAYRFHPEFATGLGVAVHVEPSAGDRMRAVEIATAAVPVHEIPATDVPGADTDPDLPELADLVLDMKRLAEMNAEELQAALSPLVDGYRAWLSRMTASLDDPDVRLADYRNEARRNLRDAERAADRIEAGIRLLAEDTDARRAFAFANAAMHLQRIHSIAAASRRGRSQRSLDETLREADIVVNRSWRPFQLAFLLLNLPALTDPAHPERSARGTSVADLLWFPTGGGKTEAYLGLTAFTLAIRRLRPDLGGYDAMNGVAVLMRYTLRLLTIQQFQRAAALICACEKLRRQDEGRWGDVPFRLGLWVGGRVTPNRTGDAEEWIKDLRRTTGRPRQVTGSPHQLTSCPWCGTPIEPGRDIEVDSTRRRTLIRCSDFECDFHAFTADGDGLPVLVVDEEIYRLGPAFVIATVDKFAQMPWLGDTQTLFGRSRLRCERHGFITPDLAQICCEGRASHQARGSLPAARHVRADPVRPPDLIIQDELHLISGPLGSLVGLYETAVDRLCTWELPGGPTVRPKVIASTATVRRAARQLGALFDRARTEVFPPPGLNAEDNFFARQRPVEARPGRRYIGICAHGVRIRSTLIRVYVAVLGAAQLLHEKYGRNPVTDPYMTLVGYFNSLRDLGGMRRLVEDDVSTRLARADQRGLARRYEPTLRELTSRLSSGDIPQVLAELELRFGPRAANGERRPIDVLLATNMIAVGVDVSRLGVMVVANQPKSTAEYIQATSRVGRSHPGLVFTVYNWARPRDLSHYETFEHFHATVYRHVEALSVTPFAYRAVDRGLTGVLVALVRGLNPEFNPNLAAGRFGRESQLADHVVNVIRRRARDVLGNARDAVDVEHELDVRLDHWARERTIPDRRLGYRRPWRSDDVAGLLQQPDGGPWTKTTCPTSLRDVEPGVRLLLLDEYDLGSGEAPTFQRVESEEEA